MTDIERDNHETLRKMLSIAAVYAPIFPGQDDVAICTLEKINYNEENGRIIHPPAPGVASYVNIEVEYERAGKGNSCIWMPQLQFEVKRSIKENSWELALPFGAKQGDKVLQDTVTKFLWQEANRKEYESK